MSEHAIQTQPAATGAGFRDMMSTFPTGVSVVSAFEYGGRPRGMTCSSVCSVALEPPTLLVCLRSGSPTLDAVLGTGAFAVNLLHTGARPTAELFASGTPHRFDLVDWEDLPGAGGPHLVADAHSIADCEVSLTQRLGDHVVVFGLVRRITRHRPLPPLLYGARQFRGWTDLADAA
ncbi:flavin reductase family protein [Kitasatospora xanthocidica]|uniref:flavin reductase family protein n=1 Tax=Kitasatospora xanthocidica TaxID=83382 RepID=UPI0036E8FBC8